MKHTWLAIALALVCGALIALLLEHGTTSNALAAEPSPQAQPKIEIEPLQPQPPKDQGRTVIKPLPSGKPLGTIGELEWYVVGLQLGVQELQDQMKTVQEQTKTLQTQVAADQNTIRTLQSSLQTLQSSLQTLQTQYANHSHRVNFPVAGHDCMALDQYRLQNANTGNSDLVALFHTAACRDNALHTPNYGVDANVSAPVQGAQTGSQGIE